MEKELTFTIHKSKILNSNTMTSLHYMAKGNIASFLRKTGYEIGFENLPKEEKELITTRKALIDSEENNKIIKSRLTKTVKKELPDLKPKEIKEEVEKRMLNDGLVLTEHSGDITINPIFNHFNVKVLVSPPSNRRLDPPNLYPTVKHLIDGLTDCGYWEDDNWQHLSEMSFAYNGVNETKDSFKLTIIISEIQ